MKLSYQTLLDLEETGIFTDKQVKRFTKRRMNLKNYARYTPTVYPGI